MSTYTYWDSSLTRVLCRQIVKPSPTADHLEEEGLEKYDQQEDLLEVEIPRSDRQSRQSRLSRLSHQSHQGQQRSHPGSPEGMSKELSEFIAQEMNQMAEGSEESMITETEESEATFSIRSPTLPQSVDSSEELAKLRPRMDIRLCPSPG